MRRLLLPLTLALALATGLVLWDAAAMLTARPVGDPDAATSTAVVRRFYDAVNDALRSGDVGALDAVIAPDFVEREPVPGTSPDRAGLAYYLSTLHAVFPQLQLTVEALTTEGNLVMTRVAGHGGERGAFLGIPLTKTPTTWGRVERFRVADGQIAERWADAGTLGLLQPLPPTRVAVHLPSQRVVSIARVTLAPHETRRWPEPGYRLIAIEAGTLAVRVDVASVVPALLAPAPVGTEERPAESLAPGSERTVTAGQRLLLPEGALCTVSAREGTPAVVLAVAMTVPATSDIVTAQRWDATNPDLAGQVLLDNQTTTLLAGVVIVAVGRATLAPDTELPTHQAAGAELVVVEAGTLALSATDDTRWGQGGTNGQSTAAAATLKAPDGALFPAGTVLAYRNAGDDSLLLLLVTITPAEH